MSSQESSSLSLTEKEKREGATSLQDRVRSLKISPSDRIDNQRSGGWFPWILALVLAIVCLWLGYRDNSIMASLGFSRPALESNSESIANSVRSKQDGVAKQDGAAPNLNASSEGNATENSAKPTASNPIALESRGYVIAKHQVLVSPQVSGRIMSLNIEEGRRVVKGDVLAEVERTEYQAEVEQTRGILLRNKAELSELETGARPQELLH